MNVDEEFFSGIFSVLRVARAGSFRAAMRGGNIGFRRLQKDVQAVEDRLGLLVFHRTPDGVVPTLEGKAIIDQAEQMETSVAKIIRLGKSISDKKDGEVMLAATEGLGTFWIAPRLQDFARLDNNVSIRLNPSMALADMRRFDIDLALQVVEPIMPHIKRVRLGTLHMMLSASETYLARHGMPETVEDLKRHTLVFQTSPQSSDRLIIEKALGEKLDQNQLVMLRNSSAHYMMIERGDGIGFLPTYGFVIGAKTVPIELPVNYSLDIWLCFYEESRLIPRVSKVIDWLANIFDPRLLPWFRREFIPPSQFARIIEQNGAREVIDRFRYSR